MSQPRSAGSGPFVVNGLGRLPVGWPLWLAGVLGFYIVVLLVIRPENYIDTFEYAKHIVDERSWPPQQQWNPFWDFGHVLWRILGYMVWNPVSGPLARLFGGDELLAAGAVLIGLSIAGGLLGATCLFLLAARSTRSLPVAAIVTAGYLSTNAVLYYQLTGMSYIAGISFQIAGLYLLHCSISDGRLTLLHGGAAGVLLGLSVVTWFPFVLSLPGVFCYALLARGGDDGPTARQRASLLAGVAAGTGALCLLVYGSVMWAGHITSIDALSQWITRSRYDKLPNRGILRMLGAIPRGFFSLGDGNTAWKRMLFDREFQRLGSLPFGALAEIWKAAMVYLVFAVSAFALWRSSWGRRQLVCLFAAALPVGIFAAFLFEATPPERYLGAFPLIFLTFAWIIADRRSGRFARIAVPVFLGCAFAVNVTALSRFHEPAEFQVARISVQMLNDRVTPNDCILLQSYQEPVLRLVKAYPFSPLSKNRFLYYVAVPWGSAHPELWKRRVAEQVQTAWKKGGHAWISNRFHAAVPDPAWGWVEGDDSRVRWADFHDFFETLDRGNEFGGTEGFSEIISTKGNQSLFNSTTLAVEHGEPAGGRLRFPGANTGLRRLLGNASLNRAREDGG